MPLPDPLLRTARLTIRPLSFDDLDAMAAMFGDPLTMAAYPRPYTREKIGMRVERDAVVFGSLHHIHAMAPTDRVAGPGPRSLTAPA